MKKLLILTTFLSFSAPCFAMGKKGKNMLNETKYITELVDAVLNGNISNVEEIIKNKKPDLNKITANQCNLLYNAATKGFAEIAEILIKAGANVNKAIEGGYTTLHIASAEGHYAIVKLCIDSSAEVNQTTEKNHTPLFMAAQNGHAESVELLLKSGAHVDSKARDGATPLIVAALNGHYSSVELLLKYDACVSQAAIDGLTALIGAASKGHAPIVQLLLEKGAKVNQIMKKNSTPLFAAAQEGHVATMQLLLKNGANEKDLNNNKKLLLTIAAEDGKTAITRYLLTNQQYEHSELTAVLNIAIENKKIDIIRLILGVAGYKPEFNHIKDALRKAQSKDISNLISNSISFSAQPSSVQQLFKAIRNSKSTDVENAIKKMSTVRVYDTAPSNAYKSLLQRHVISDIAVLIAEYAPEITFNNPAHVALDTYQIITENLRQLQQEQKSTAQQETAQKETQKIFAALVKAKRQLLDEANVYEQTPFAMVCSNDIFADLKDSVCTTLTDEEIARNIAHYNTDGLTKEEYIWLAASEKEQEEREQFFTELMTEEPSPENTKKSSRNDVKEKKEKQKSSNSSSTASFKKYQSMVTTQAYVSSYSSSSSSSQESSSSPSSTTTITENEDTFGQALVQCAYNGDYLEIPNTNLRISAHAAQRMLSRDITQKMRKEKPDLKDSIVDGRGITKEQVQDLYNAHVTPVLEQHSDKKGDTKYRFLYQHNNLVLVTDVPTDNKARQTVITLFYKNSHKPTTQSSSSRNTK